MLQYLGIYHICDLGFITENIWQNLSFYSDL